MRNRLIVRIGGEKYSCCSKVRIGKFLAGILTYLEEIVEGLKRHHAMEKQSQQTPLKPSDSYL